MIENITPNTLANTIRMAANSRRPKAIFLASDATDVDLVRTLLAQRECRIIPAHSRENAVRAFGILVNAGWEGVVTAVNAGFIPPTDRNILGQSDATRGGVGIEGIWEELQERGAILSGHRVRVTIIDEPIDSISSDDTVNATMLEALNRIEAITIQMNPNKDLKDYLREAREGAMYGADN